jgi:hypothetical protein
MLCNATHRLGDRQRVTLRQRVRDSVRAIRAVRNTRVFLTETRVVADALSVSNWYGYPTSGWWFEPWFGLFRFQAQPKTRPTLPWGVCYLDRKLICGHVVGLELDCCSKNMVPTPLPPFQYLSFDRIMIQSICKLFSFSPSFTSCMLICNPTDIR